MFSIISDLPITYQWLRVKARLMEARAIRNINSREANMNSKSCVNCRLNKRLHTARKESSKIWNTLSPDIFIPRRNNFHLYICPALYTHIIIRNEMGFGYVVRFYYFYATSKKQFFF